ncbi:hypothetical protein [Micromonospora wenchangensis]|uniref:hypothetical protein n=1 Tax=Micromonospora wenchangensis TaxID=1185415 RepID=UPI003D7604B0
MSTSNSLLPLVAARPGAPGAVLSVEVDTRLPGTLLGRKVYKTGPLPWRVTRPHVHNSPHRLVCVTGRFQVAVRPEPDLPAQHIEIPAGSFIVVPGGLPHQLRLNPHSVVSSFFPPAIWLSTDEGLEFFDGDWFA